MGEKKQVNRKKKVIGNVGGGSLTEIEASLCTVTADEPLNLKLETTVFNSKSIPKFSDSTDFLHYTHITVVRNLRK